MRICILLFVFHLLFTVSTNCNGEKRPKKTSKYGQISAKLEGFRDLQQKLLRNPRFGASFLCGPSRRLCRVFQKCPGLAHGPFLDLKFATLEFFLNDEHSLRTFSFAVLRTNFFGERQWNIVVLLVEVYVSKEQEIWTNFGKASSVHNLGLHWSTSGYMWIQTLSDRLATVKFICLCVSMTARSKKITASS